jgi:membrane protein
MGDLRGIRDEIRALSVGQAVRLVLRGYDEHDLLTFASALAFRVLFAMLPLALLGLGVLGGLGLDEEWTREWGPRVKDSMSEPAFAVIDDTTRRVLGDRQTFWMTAGAALAVWAIASAMRTIMDVLDRVYGGHRERSFLERMRVSLLLGLAVTALLLAAVGSATAGDAVLRAAGIENALILWLRWPLAFALLLAVIALLIARAPVDRRPLHWVTLGSTLVVIAWIGTSLVLAWYLTAIADYGSIFGALATVVIVLSYLYFASAAFLTGAELDAILHSRVDGGRRPTMRTARPAARR